MIVLEKIMYVIIILFCLYKLMPTYNKNNFDPEILHPSFIGYNI